MTDSSSTDPIVFHLTRDIDFPEAVADYRHPSLASEGFIHASTIEQLAESANIYFADSQSIFLLVIDCQKIASTLRWDRSRNQELFPHIYGPIPREAILAILPFSRRPDDQFEVSLRLRNVVQNLS